MAAFAYFIAAFVVIVAMSIIVVLWYFRITLGTQVQRPVLHPGYCMQCKYVLHGLARGGKCPECATEYNLDVPLKMKTLWMTAPDAYRTLVRMPVLLLCSLPVTFIQFSFTYAHLRLAGWSGDDAFPIAEIQASEGSDAHLAVWLILLAIILIPFLRYLSWGEFWRTIGICALTPPLLVFLAGFHKSQWTQGVFAGFIHGTLSIPGFLAACLTLGLVIAAIVPFRACGLRASV